MHLRPLAVVALLLLGCTRSNPSDSSDEGDSSECPVGGEGCPCAENSSCGAGLVCASQMCVSTEESSSSGGSDGATAGSEGSSSSSASSTSVNSTSGDDSSSSSVADTSTGDSDSSTSGTTSADESSSGSTTEPAPACGDGELDDGEDCDDGNTLPGDGCDDACAWEPWQHEGVAHNVPIADLVGWELCWSGDYGAGDSVDWVTIACDGDHLMMACRPIGSDTLTVAAHAPREDVLWPVDYGGGERHEANGVNWYWSPMWNIEGFAESGNNDGCDPNGDGIQPSHLCWLNADDEPLTFQTGARCGLEDINSNEADDWERVMLQAWD